MITNLHIENYVLIDHLDIDLQNGLNIVTGETGAGKSILLGALGLLKGARSDASAVSNGKNCIIEATFECSGYGLETLFERLDLEYDDQCVIRRVITPAGKSRAYVNDFPVQLSQLKELGDHLIDIHSQHQTLLLGKNSFQMEVLDCVACNIALLERYKVEYYKFKEISKELNQMSESSKLSQREEEFLRHQFSQLAEANIKEGELDELEERQNVLSHSEQIEESLIGALNIMSGDDEAVLPRLKSAVQSLSHIESLSPQHRELCERVRSVFLELKDVDSELSTLSEGVSYDPDELERINNRLNLIYTLFQRNHLSSIEELLDLQSELKQKIDSIDNSDYLLTEKQKELERQRVVSMELALKLHEKRIAVAKKIEKRVVSQLSELGMSSSRLSIDVKMGEDLQEYGVDSVNFMFSANEGVKLEKIDKVASGGEMSRLMLSLKSLMAEHKSLPTIIFDEIDSGVSGSVADKMGEIMEKLGSEKQIINITHLAQVAAKGAHHYFVAKALKDGKTVSVITKLTDQERVEQIAAMISGRDITDAALDQARKLLNFNN